MTGQAGRWSRESRLRGPSLSTPPPAPDFFAKEPVAAVVCLCHLAFALLLNLHVCVYQRRRSAEENLVPNTSLNSLLA